MPCLHTESQALELTGPKTPGHPAPETTRRSREKKEERHRGRVLSPLRNLRTKAEKWGFRKGLDEGERHSNESCESTTNRRIRKNSCFVKMSSAWVQMQPELNVLLLGRRRESHPPCGSTWRLAPSAAQDKSWLCFSLNHSEDFGGAQLAKLLLFPESSFIHQYQQSQFPRTARSTHSAGPCGLGKGCDWMMGLLGDRASHLGLQEICKKVLVHICDVLAAEHCSLAMTTKDESGKQVLGPFFHTKKSAHSQTHPDWDRCLMGHVASTGWPLNISDTNEDPRCSKGVHKPADCRPKSILSVPILNQQAEVIGVVMVVNKIGKACFFSKNDEKVLSSHMALLGVIVDNKQLTEKTDQQSQHSQVVLELVQLLAEQHQCVETILTKMATVILQACKAKLCNVFISDPESKEPFSWMVCVENNEQSQSTCSSRRDVDHQDVFYAYAMRVWNTMEMLNVAMEKSVTQPVAAEGHLHSLICAPIRDRQKKGLLGVCQLLNKASADPGEGSSFSRAEEHLLQIFVEYCSLAFHTVSVQKTAERSLNKLTVTEEVLSYHLCSCAAEAEAEDFQECMIPSALSLGLMDFSFSDGDLPAAASTQAAVRMFLDLNLLQNFGINYKILCQWVLSVRRGYRSNVAYHNWSHALSTAHCMFAILNRTEQLQGNLSSLEILALMISALSHDLDHRGVNNSYIERAQQPLAQLYTHSTLEHHHFNICLLILNTPETGILGNLSAEDYKACIGMIEKNILATDLNVHLQKKAELFELAENQRLQWKNEDHRELLRSALMTACDVCSITKPWPVQRRVAQLVAEEFFAQGDREIHEFNIQPIAVMDRGNTTRLPELQIQYIDSICAPLYRALSTLFEPCAPLLDGCMKNREEWESLIQRKEENKDVVKK